VAGGVATAVAIGSSAWYFHMYGPELQAMTMAEEGYVDSDRVSNIGRFLSPLFTFNNNGKNEQGEQ